MTMSTPAGWYDDGQGRQRWWDGVQWTDRYAERTSPPPYAPVGSDQSQSTPKNFWGLLSLIFGIVGIALAWLTFGGVVGIAGLIFGVVGLAAVKSGAATNKGMNIWGVVLSGVSILLSFVFLIGYLALGAWVTSETSLAGTGTSIDSEVETEAPEESTLSGNEFPIGDGYTMEATISAVQLDPPSGFDGEEPTQGDYDSSWGAAQATDGQIAVVDITIHNNNDHAAPGTAGSITLMKEGLVEPPNCCVFNEEYDFDVNVFTLDVPANGSVTWKVAFALPASEVNHVLLQTQFVEDLGEGKRIVALQSQPGEGCAVLPRDPGAPFTAWTCLQRK